MRRSDSITGLATIHGEPLPTRNANPASRRRARFRLMPLAERLHVRALAFGCALVLATGCGDGSGATDVPGIPVTPPGNQVSRMVVLSAPSGAFVGKPFSIDPVVQLLDAARKPALVAGVRITISISEGTLLGTTTVETDGLGRASFVGLAVDGIDAGSMVELRFECAGVRAVTSSLYLPLAANSLEPIGSTSIFGYAGETLTPGPGVLVRDYESKPLAGAKVEFAYRLPGRIVRVIVTSDSDGVAVLPSFQFPDLPTTTTLTAWTPTEGEDTYNSTAFTMRGEVRGTANP